MSKRLFLLVLIAWMAAPLDLHAITAAPQGNSSGNVGQTDESVVNVFLERMDKNRLYAKDGSEYLINSDTKVIYNTHSGSKTKAAELHFKGGRLISVIIK